MEYYAAIKRNEMLVLKRLCDRQCANPLTGHVQKEESCSEREQSQFPPGWGLQGRTRNRQCHPQGLRFSSGMGSHLQLSGGWSSPTCRPGLGPASGCFEVVELECGTGPWTPATQPQGHALCCDMGSHTGGGSRGKGLSDATDS